MDSHVRALSRRGFLAAATASLVSTTVGAPAGTEVSTPENYRVIRARRASVDLLGRGRATTAVSTYDGIVPGPILRLRQGEELKVQLINELPEPTIVHWHGIRLPNAMDGAPDLTQPPIEPGASFLYRFAVPDAGTFWYHSSFRSPGQLGHGLYGAVVVEEARHVDVDRDVVLILADWRLNPDGSLAALVSGHAELTVNGEPSVTIPVATNERVRVRLINAATARIFRLRVDQHRVFVMAIDGQPAEPYQARDGRVTIGPGNRMDLFIDATLEPGASAALVAEEQDSDVALAHLVYASGPVHLRLRPDPEGLPPNRLPERMQFAGAFRLEMTLDGAGSKLLPYDGGMKDRETPSQSIVPGSGHTVGRTWPGASGPPMFSVKRGRVVQMAFVNRSALTHSMHIHGHSFRLLDALDDGWKPLWLDNVLVAPARTERIAFAADNPGKWMLQGSVLGHEDGGMAGWFEVT